MWLFVNKIGYIVKINVNNDNQSWHIYWEDQSFLISGYLGRPAEFFQKLSLLAWLALPLHGWADKKNQEYSCKKLAKNQ